MNLTFRVLPALPLQLVREPSNALWCIGVELQQVGKVSKIGWQAPSDSERALYKEPSV